MSEQSEMNERSEVKRYQFLNRKISPPPIGMQNVCLPVGVN